MPRVTKAEKWELRPAHKWLEATAHGSEGCVTQALAIDVFTDIVCPWCYIGTERLEKVLGSLAPGLELSVAHHPFFLARGVPEEGIVVADDLRRKYGGDPKRLFAMAEAAAKTSGMDLDLQKQPRSYPTVKAHTLVRHAEAKGTQRALLRALFRTYFDEAKNITDPSVLAAAAEPHGFTAEEVAALVSDESELAATRRAAEEANEGGIHAVPFFIFGQRFAVSGAQTEEVLRAAIAKATAS